MDNQQGRKDFFSWFAGFLDGDGSISTSARQLGTSYSLNYVIRFTTTCKQAVDYLHEKLTEYEIGHHIGRESMCRGFQKVVPWSIVISGMQRCKKILDEVIPCLVIKKQEALWMREIIRLREPINRMIPYGDQEKKLHLAIKLAKSNRHLTDYSPSPVI